MKTIRDHPYFSTFTEVKANTYLAAAMPDSANWDVRSMLSQAAATIYHNTGAIPCIGTFFTLYGTYAGTVTNLEYLFVGADLVICIYFTQIESEPDYA